MTIICGDVTEVALAKSGEDCLVQFKTGRLQQRGPFLESLWLTWARRSVVKFLPKLTLHIHLTSPAS